MASHSAAKATTNDSFIYKQQVEVIAQSWTMYLIDLQSKQQPLSRDLQDSWERQSVEYLQRLFVLAQPTNDTSSAFDCSTETLQAWVNEAVKRAQENLPPMDTNNPQNEDMPTVTKPASQPSSSIFSWASMPPVITWEDVQEAENGMDRLKVLQKIQYMDDVLADWPDFQACLWEGLKTTAVDKKGEQAQDAATSSLVLEYLKLYQSWWKLTCAGPPEYQTIQDGLLDNIHRCLLTCQSIEAELLRELLHTWSMWLPSVCEKKRPELLLNTPPAHVLSSSQERQVTDNVLQVWTLILQRPEWLSTVVAVDPTAHAWRAVCDAYSSQALQKVLQGKPDLIQAWKDHFQKLSRELLSSASALESVVGSSTSTTKQAEAASDEHVFMLFFTHAVLQTTRIVYFPAVTASSDIIYDLYKAALAVPAAKLSQECQTEGAVQSMVLDAMDIISHAWREAQPEKFVQKRSEIDSLTRTILSSSQR
jgi:hypothetical protein